MRTANKLKLPIGEGYYLSNSLPLACQRCINWIPISPEESALNEMALDDPDGLTEWTDTGERPNRGAQVVGNTPYFVCGQNLYQVTAGGGNINRGSISGTKRVSMANNGLKLVIVVPGAQAYIYDVATTTLSQITDPDYLPSDTVVFKDGYFVFTASNGNIFFCSALNDPASIDALDFGSAEVSPDKIVAAHVNHNELYILGTDTIEIFQNVGGSGFPFQRIEGANIQKGCYAKFSIVEFDNSFLFIGGGLNEMPAVWRVASSSSAQKVSTAAIDIALQEFNSTEISNAFAFTYARRGNFFAAFTITSNRIPSRTFVYDATSSAMRGYPVWHERQTGVVDNYWRVAAVVKAFGKLLCGDLIDGRIGYFNPDEYTDYGEERFRSVTSQPFFQEELPLFQGQMEVTMESGVGLTLGNGSDPQLMMDYSDDGGRTWAYQTFRSYGEIGKYRQLCIWRRMGRIPRHRILRFTTTEPVKSCLLKVESYAEAGTQ